jgi:DNA-binding HxlR family transcriptional regulator
MQSYKADSKVTGQSAKSYQEFLKSGKMSKYRELIVEVLSKGNETRRALTNKVKAVHPSNLCAPLKILENEGVIKVVGYVQDLYTSREVSLYGLCQRQVDVEFPLISIGNSYASSEHLSQDLEPKSQDNE